MSNVYGIIHRIQLDQRTGGTVMFRKKLLRCSFCGKDEREVEKLVAGPKVYICDKCVEVATCIMTNDSAVQPSPSSGKPILSV